MVSLQLGHEREPSQRPSKRRVVAHRLYTHRVAALVESELDLVPGDDPEPIAEVFGDHNLPFRSNSMSHTS